MESPRLAAVQKGAQGASSVGLDLCTVSLLLDHTLFVSLEIVVATLPVRLFSFKLRERVSERVEHSHQ